MSIALRSAGAMWLIGGLTFLVTEAIAAAAYPGYSYLRDYISDLGVPGQSARALTMNLGFVMDGALYGLAALTAARSLKASAWFVAFAMIHSLGAIIIGTVPSGPGNDLHIFGAGMAIVGGNLASLIAPRAHRHRAAGRALGVLGLASLALLEANRVLGITILPDGLLERGAVYPITAWEILTAFTLLTMQRSLTHPSPRDR